MALPEQLKNDPEEDWFKKFASKLESNERLARMQSEVAEKSRIYRLDEDKKRMEMIQQRDQLHNEAKRKKKAELKRLQDIYEQRQREYKAYQDRILAEKKRQEELERQVQLENERKIAAERAKKLAEAAAKELADAKAKELADARAKELANQAQPNQTVRDNS